jgi:hypothetical protein
MTQQVSTGVAQYVQTFFVFGGDDGQGSIGFDQLAGIHQFTVYPTGNARLGKTRTYVRGHVHDGNGVGKLTLAAVRQSNDWHCVFPYTVVPPTKGHMRDGKIIQKG